MLDFRFLNLTSFINLDFNMNFSETLSFRSKYLSKLVTSMLIEDLWLKLFVELKHYSESNELNSTIFNYIYKMLIIQEQYPKLFYLAS